MIPGWRDTILHGCLVAGAWGHYGSGGGELESYSEGGRREEKRAKGRAARGPKNYGPQEEPARRPRDSLEPVIPGRLHLKQRGGQGQGSGVQPTWL